MMGQNGQENKSMFESNPLFAEPTVNGVNPFGMSPTSSPMGGGFNVDDLVKRIDAKIAELEEEERK